MKKVWATCAFAALAACANAAPSEADLVSGRLNALRAAAKCGDAASVWRHWCIAAAFETGHTADLPRGKVLLGITIELEEGTDAAKALFDRVGLVALAIDADGKVKLTDVKPSNADEEKSTVEAMSQAAAVFKGKAKVVKLPKDLGDYLKTLRGAYEVSKSGGQWTWTGQTASRMRKVDAFWVVIEVPRARNGIFATILTDAWE
jgi:hypothetical protein